MVVFYRRRNVVFCRVSHDVFFCSSSSILPNPQFLPMVLDMFPDHSTLLSERQSVVDRAQVPPIPIALESFLLEQFQVLPGYRREFSYEAGSFLIHDMFDPHTANST